MQGTLKVGIVGLGRLGQRHAENLAHHVPHAHLVAACSPLESERDWAGNTLGVAHCYADYAALLAHPGLDAVFLVTPTALHAEQIVAALQAGKHVFCEKPLSLDLQDCLRVEAEAARHPELKVMIGFVRRFDASYRDAARFRAALRRQLPRRGAQDRRRADRQAVSDTFADARSKRSRWILRALRREQRRHLPRLQRARYRSGALAAGQPDAAPRL